MKVKLSDLVEAVEFDTEEIQQFVNMATGEVVFFTDEMLNAAEKEGPLDDYPEWEREAIEEARKISDSAVEDYHPTPTKYDFHEYSVMEDFCHGIEDAEASDRLLDLIRGRGFFRRFKDEVCRLGIETEWYSFRDKALKSYLVRWCEDEGIEYEDDLPGS